MCDKTEWIKIINEFAKEKNGVNIQINNQDQFIYFCIFFKKETLSPCFDYEQIPCFPICINLRNEKVSFIEDIAMNDKIIDFNNILFKLSNYDMKLDINDIYNEKYYLICNDMKEVEIISNEINKSRMFKEINISQFVSNICVCDIDKEKNVLFRPLDSYDRNMYHKKFNFFSQMKNIKNNEIESEEIKMSNKELIKGLFNMEIGIRIKCIDLDDAINEIDKYQKNNLSLSEFNANYTEEEEYMKKEYSHLYGYIRIIYNDEYGECGELVLYSDRSELVEKGLSIKKFDPEYVKKKKYITVNDFKEEDKFREVLNNIKENEEKFKNDIFEKLFERKISLKVNISDIYKVIEKIETYEEEKLDFDDFKINFTEGEEYMINNCNDVYLMINNSYDDDDNEIAELTILQHRKYIDKAGIEVIEYNSSIIDENSNDVNKEKIDISVKEVGVPLTESLSYWTKDENINEKNDMIGKIIYINKQPYQIISETELLCIGDQNNIKILEYSEPFEYMHEVEGMIVDNKFESAFNIYKVYINSSDNVNVATKEILNEDSFVLIKKDDKECYARVQCHIGYNITDENYWTLIK